MPLVWHNAAQGVLMIKRVLILVLLLALFPLSLHATETIEKKAISKKLEDIKKEFKDEHKVDIKKQMKGTKIGDEYDLTRHFFSSDTYIGITNMTGNTKSLAINGTNKTRYRINRFENTWNAGAFYSRVFSSTDPKSTIGTSARYIYGNYRVDYFILQRLTVFLGGGGYTNEFKGMELAGQGFTGLKYYFLQAESYYFSGSLGYNFTYENVVDPDPDRKIHSAGLMLDYEQQLTSNFKIEEHVEVLQDVQDGHEIRVNSDTLLRVLVSKHVGFALGFLIRFDNQPPGGYEKLDTITNFSLALTF